MNKVKAAVTLFEYGYLGACEKSAQSGHIVKISKSSFSYLKALCLCDESESRFLSFRSVNNTEVLQVKNYAGVLFTPDGTQIEVLPKTGRKLAGIEGESEARQSLLNMLMTLGDFRNIQTHNANLNAAKMPLLEVFIGQFLNSVNQLLKKGLRSTYVYRQDNLAFLKGKLLIGQQVRQNAVNKHKFYVEHDEFLLDRPINRLIHSALIKVVGYSKTVQNQKLANELLFAFSDIPFSRNIKSDLNAVQLDRGMNYYIAPFNWTKLVLNGFTPLTMEGSNNALSLLFPLEAVFESYVAAILAAVLPKRLTLNTQVRRETLVRFNGLKFFQLKPDLHIESKEGDPVVLDTKWKLINSAKNNGTDKFCLSQGDIYQMFAYGHKYLKGKGELFLIYPSHDDFRQPIEHSFEFSEDMRLWVVPFDISVGVDIEDRLLLSERCSFQLN